MRFSGRVLYVGCIGNVGVYARQHRNIGSCECNGNDVYIIIVFLNCVGARIARPHEGDALNVMFLSTLEQENSVGTAGLQCKPLQAESLTYCCFARSAHCLHMSFRAVGVSRIRVGE